MTTFYRNKVIPILLQRPLQGSYGMEYKHKGWGVRVSTVGREGRGNPWQKMVIHVGRLSLHMSKKRDRRETWESHCTGLLVTWTDGDSVLLLWLRPGHNPPGGLIRCLSHLNTDCRPDHLTSLAPDPSSLCWLGRKARLLLPEKLSFPPTMKEAKSNVPDFLPWY